MLIICHDNFVTHMEPFVSWKIETGMHTEIVESSSFNDAAEIKSYVKNYYDTKGLTFLLLVGDDQQIPTNQIWSGDSDNEYGYLYGNDSYPEIFVGRFSAETPGQVKTMVNRTITYEKFPIKNSSKYRHGLGVASEEGPGDDNEFDFEHLRNIRTDLLNFTYDEVYELYEGSQGGQDANGDPSSTDMLNIINSGVSVINYTGHGSNNSCGTTGFSSSTIDSLTNLEIWPFYISVACVNGNFVGGTCFAESWLRSKKDNSSKKPTGAVAVIMSTINQSWDPPMCGQDEMMDLLLDVYPDNRMRTFGGITMNGCIEMNDQYGMDGYEMTDTWTIFGDPSVLLRTDSPHTMIVSHDPQITMNHNAFNVQCDMEGAKVALTMNDSIYDVKWVNNGLVELQLNGHQPLDTFLITITAFNGYPYIVELPVSLESSVINKSWDNIEIYPIPAKNELVIDFNNDETLKLLTLTNVLGKQWINVETFSSKYVLKRINIASGTYFLRIQNGTSISTRKIIFN